MSVPCNTRLQHCWTTAAIVFVEEVAALHRPSRMPPDDVTHEIQMASEDFRHIVHAIRCAMEVYPFLATQASELEDTMQIAMAGEKDPTSELTELY